MTSFTQKHWAEFQRSDNKCEKTLAVSFISLSSSGSLVVIIFPRHSHSLFLARDSLVTIVLNLEGLKYSLNGEHVCSMVGVR